MSAIVAAVASERAGSLAGSMLPRLEHRGSHATGVSGVDAEGTPAHFHCEGKASKAYTSEANQELGDTRIKAAIGHNLNDIATGALEAQQPYEHGSVLLAFTGALTDRSELDAYLRDHEEADPRRLSDSAAVCRALSKTVLEREVSLSQAIRQLRPRLVGGFALVAMDTASEVPEVIGFRGELGVRPLEIARLACKGISGWLLASETHAFQRLGRRVRSVRPGEMVSLREDGMTSEQLAEPDEHFSAFELIYFTHPNSITLGQPISKTRAALGKQAAAELIDRLTAEGSELSSNAVVLAAPKTAVQYARSFAKNLERAFNLERLFKPWIQKNPDIGRSSMQPTQEAQDAVLANKFIYNEAKIQGKDVIVIDDSLRRRNTAKKVVAGLRKAGAHTVTVVVASPPMTHPDRSGMDGTKQSQLAAATMSAEELRVEINCDRLMFLSVEGFQAGIAEATGRNDINCDMSWFTGSYPYPLDEDKKRNIEDLENPFDLYAVKQPALVQ